MPDQIRDVTKFSRYFNIEAPGSTYQALLFIMLGAITGLIAFALTHLHSGYSILPLLLSGASIGIITVTLPSILTVLFVKAVSRKIKLKHAFFAVLAVSLLYSCFILIDSLIFALTRNPSISYLVIILSNALIYGYWFLINRVVMNQRRSQVLTAAMQPVTNVLLFIPMGMYLFGSQAQFGASIIKLWSGMAVFMVIGYIVLYVMDRPAKKALRISGVDLITAMVSQWLYDITRETDIFKGIGTKRDVNVDIIVMRGEAGTKAVFVNPDIHFGPFHDVGGGVATEAIGRRIYERLNASPFVMHTAVSFEDNPVSTRQIFSLSNTIADNVSSLRRNSFRRPSATLYLGNEGPCNAIGISFGGQSILVLTKAPNVTEDIDREVGRTLAAEASRKLGRVLLVDAHNSRSESESTDELRGVYPGSKYSEMYAKAIQKMNPVSSGPMSFGSSSIRLKDKLKGRDLGEGYTSLAFFQIGSERLMLVYFDANNMLPKFRAEIISYLKGKFNSRVEVCTSDTHSVNTIALPASNVLGRETKPDEILPILEEMARAAVSGAEKVEYAHSAIVVKKFKVWGKGSDDTLVKVSREVIRSGKRRIPIIIAAGIIIAAWVIYLA